MTLTATEPCPVCGRVAVEDVKGELTDAQARVWQHIQAMVAEGTSPTYVKLASRAGLTPATLHEHVTALKELGLVVQWDRHGFEIVQ